MGVMVEILPGGQILCPHFGCGAATGVEVLGDARQPPRWFCVSGHSGYFTVAEPLKTGRGYPAAPLGDPHGSRRYTRCCSECGEPVRVPARKCAECRSHG